MHEVLGNLIPCRKCQRKMLIERTLIGTNHDSSINVICWECLTPEQQEKAITSYKITKPE